MANKHTREEQVKNYVAEERFAAYDCKNIIRNLDFYVAQRFTKQRAKSVISLVSLFWGADQQKMST